MEREIFVTDIDEALEGLSQGNLELVDCGEELRKDPSVVITAMKARVSYKLNRDALKQKVLTTFEYMDPKLTYDNEFLCDLIAVVPYFDHDIEEIINGCVIRNSQIYIGKLKESGENNAQTLAIEKEEFEKNYANRIIQRKKDIQALRNLDYIDHVAKAKQEINSSKNK